MNLLALEYCKRTRQVTRELLKGISESLGLEASDLEKFLNVESGLQIFIANLYPPCPQPELALGMPPHSDHGLLTLLIQNGINGLQVQHKGKWVNVNAMPNSFLVNTGDHLEIFSNGKYRSNIHRAVLTNKATRISLATPTGPSLETVVTPAPELINNENRKPAYIGMKYKDYLELQQSSMLDGKSILDRVRGEIEVSEASNEGCMVVAGYVQHTSTEPGGMSLWWDDSVTVTVLRACPNVIDTIIVASHLNQSYSATWVYGTLIEKIRQISGVGLRTLCSLILFLGFAAVIGMKFYEP
ncbi:2-oxoglutarate and Fe(II)-dependent oxygenase superfamily protein [Prunus dulcis]|uniref:2-oxoglutarate and Fe(II)-dependent oxygenase superfamily protein n=1 Tax=Prunus dulcis TaxID=3755 RepID=A0A4Y1RZG6_PRUDU|nr:2-oxoglutarate and Fe(II)-dependent oxygenase superfamily protein [Prunus dulcis]